MKLIEQGNSIIIIEHNPKILKLCDWIIELGPQGGPEGGEIICSCDIKSIKNNKKSLIREFL